MAARPKKIRARSLTRLNCAAFGMTPLKIQTGAIADAVIQRLFHLVTLE